MKVVCGKAEVDDAIQRRNWKIKEHEKKSKEGTCKNKNVGVGT